MNRTKIFLYNSVASAIYQIIMLVSGIIVPRIMLKFYGSELNGLVTSITQFISYFNLVEAGLAGAATYALYKPLADNDIGLISRIVVATKNFYKKSGWVFVLLVVLLSVIYPFIVQIECMNYFSILTLIILIGVKGALEFFTLGKYRALLSADQKSYIISISSIVYQIVYTIVVILLSYLKANILFVYLFALFGIFARSIILIMYSKKKYGYIDYNAIPKYDELNKRHDALYLQILGVMQKGAPVLILSFIVQDLKLVSVYAVFNIVLSGVNSILEIFITGLSATFGDVIARGEYENLKSYYTKFETIYYTLITIIYSSCYILIMPFIKLYTAGITDIDYNVPIIGLFITLNGFLYNLKTPQGMLVISAGMYKETKLQSTIQALIIVVLGMVLAPYFGIVGVLIASCASNLYRDIDLMFFVPKYITHMDWKNTFLKICKIIVVAICILLPFKFIEYNTSSYFSWFIAATATFAYALAVSLTSLIIFDRDIVIFIFNKLSILLRRINCING